MILATYTPEQSSAAREFLEDFADAVAGVERCRACGKPVCDHPDLEFAGLAPVRNPDVSSFNHGCRNAPE